ncbi:PaaI family thioesterase [Fructilactobacillus sp. Tb1]|uniref:PaaI family thioesterase n=1 Tax=Fructilactobacillus sp. Tb1 TaxID=3422304 RepID=UPI003D2D1391
MNLIELLHIKTELLTPDKVILSMEITPEMQQPFGLMHGGISCVLAETAASMGANENLDTNKQVAVGLDIQTTHLRPVKLGLITAEAISVKIGHQTQTWNVKIFHNKRQISESNVNLFNQTLTNNYN